MYFICTLCVLCLLTSCTDVQKSYKTQYTYGEYTKKQQEFCKRLYNLTPEKTDLAYKTTLHEHEATAVLRDFMLYNPYSYWLNTENTLYCTENTLYLHCRTDFTADECIKVDAQLRSEINACIAYIKEQVGDNPSGDPENTYKALFTYLYSHAEIQDGTYRAPIKCCLVDRACNCQGFTYTFLYICSLLGLPAEAQYGNSYNVDSVAWTVDYDKFQNNTLAISRDNAGHVWIVVPMDGVPYYLDIYAQKADEDPEPHFLTADGLIERGYLWN